MTMDSEQETGDVEAEELLSPEEAAAERLHRHALNGRIGALCLLIIALLGGCNTFAAIGGSGLMLVSGPALPFLIDDLVQAVAAPAWRTFLVLASGFAVTAMYATFGVFAWRWRVWGFIAGSALCLIELILYVLFQAWIDVIVFAVLFFYIARGILGAVLWRQAEAEI